MKTFTKRFVAAAALLAAIVVQPLAAVDRADKREIIRQARAAYYSLRRSGLDSFQVSIGVNWSVVLGGKTSNAEQMRLLNSLHFGASFGADGKVLVTHRTDVAAPNATVQKGYDQIFEGIDQVVTGFMDTYQPFMVGSPFPAVDSDYVLEDFENGYRLTYKEGASTQVITKMTKTLAIVESVVHAPDFDSIIRPSFTTTADGYVLAGYDADYKPTKTTTGVVRLTGTLDHGMVEGLRLPRKLYFDSSVDGTPNSTEITFTDYTIKKK
jgi:hypothetical protein